MKKTAYLIVATLMLCALTGFGVRPTYAQGGQVTVQLHEQNGSGETGTATLTEQTVELTLAAWAGGSTATNN